MNSTIDTLENQPVANMVSGPWKAPIESPKKIPARAEILVVGGGIVGVSTAWFLAKQGIDVVLCEKGHIAGEQSGRNWGWVRQQGRDPRELPMMMDSIRIFRNLEEELGESVGFVEGGCLFAARKEKDVDAYHEWIKTAQEFELDTKVIGKEQLPSLLTGSAVDWAGAMYTASDGRAEPHKTTAAIARAATRAGATILSGCAVRGIETSAGAVSAVITEHGRIATSTVLCAAGAWTSMFCRSMGISVPQLNVRGTVARTEPAAKVLDGNLFDDKLGIRRRQDGGYTIAHGSLLDHGITPSTFRYAFKFLPALKKEIKVLKLRFGRDFLAELRVPREWPLDKPSPFEKQRVLDPAPSKRNLAEVHTSLGELFPALANTRIVESWAGMVETTPDVVPVIDGVEDMRGFHIATGFSGHGFGIGPGAGKAIAAMLSESPSTIDLTPFKLSRFFDGSPIRPQSTI